ncbi:MAG TPA: YidC/Oxa1 family insertase periplasmic-domain containing protein [Gemmatimonadaceae bacterium]|nr:YidC/Oxa1 family insertase periplasmic-domain containing protein [Gemmatimonadaceae bacterium]
MDKRSLLALLLIAVVIVGGNLLTPRAKPASTDSIASVPAPAATTLPDSIAPVPPAATARPSDTAAARPAIGPATALPAQTARPDTTIVTSTGRVMHFVSPGAVPARITLTEYKDLRSRTGELTLAPTEGQLLRYRIVNGADTIRLDQVAFTRATTPRGVVFTSASPAIEIAYDVDTAKYLTHTRLSFPGAAPDAKLLIELAPDLASGEADEAEDLRNLAYGFRPALGDVQSVNLSSLDSTESRIETGPLEWVAIRNKYFVVAVLNPDSTRQFSGFVMRGGSRRDEKRPTGIAIATLPLATGNAVFDLYTGPQSWRVLRSVGYELSNVNPYAGWAWLRPMVEPFATIVMRALLGMKELIGLSYGWVLVIFGIGIRLLLWPLNQSAMRTSIKMQALQPELAAVQKRYAKDPEGQRTAMMKLYADHGMSPLSPLMGCLPMLIPMPILFALYFVFQNTIEFRGVPFLWLPDISLKDPYYITPILMGASMLVLSWIGLRAAPANPQAKVMGYMMPAMFTIMFLNFASGLNMYYAVQNLIAIPQQWLLTRERTRATATTVKTAPAVNKRR